MYTFGAVYGKYPAKCIKIMPQNNGFVNNFYKLILVCFVSIFKAIAQNFSSQVKIKNIEWPAFLTTTKGIPCQDQVLRVKKLQ